jgi:predicted nucleotidyltransferase
MEAEWTTPKSRKILDKTVAILRASLSPGRIILFGSRARKRHPPGADFDIAIDHP